MRKFFFICCIWCFQAFGQKNLSDLKYLLDDATATFPGRSVMVLNSPDTEWKFSEAGKNEWKQATVPGCVHTDIAGSPEELYYGDNEKKYQWIEEKVWEYVTSFRLNDELKKKEYISYELVFDQLDVYASVYINGQLVKQTDNAFIQWKVDIGNYLKKDTSLNVLRIVFESPVNKAKEQAKKYPYTFPGGERVFTRKAQFEYGWDFGPRFVTSGIRKPVYLVAYTSQAVEITDIRMTEKKVDSLKADMEAVLSLNSVSDRVVYVFCHEDYQRRYTKVKLRKGINIIHIPFTIDHPQLWWPRGYGSSVFYSLKFAITTKSPGKKKNEILDEKNTVHAFCDIQLVQEPDTYGQSFYFKVNGQPVFARGVNMIPYDVFNESWNDTQLGQIYDLNANMVRVWGGGIYPSDEFYLYCLANGIMVWQDFMFACAMYPYKGGEKVFSVMDETYEQARRLRNFSNIALWCGNNEVSEGWHNWGWQKEFKYTAKDSADIWSQYVEAFRSGIPRSLNSQFYFGKETDYPEYVDTSPQHGWGRSKSLTEGDCHYWGVWWGKQPIDTFNHRIPRFMSEYGMQSMPSVHYLIKHMPISSSNMDRNVLANHQKHPSGFGTLDFYLEKYYRVPQNIFHYAYASQLLQAMTYKTAIEAHRRHRDKCMGTLLWQMNDCWPGITWSLVDHDLNKKIAYEQVKDCYATLMLSVQDQQKEWGVYVVSDSLNVFNDTLFFTLYDTKGKMLKEWSKPVTIAPGESRQYLAIAKSETNGYFLSTVYAVVRLGHAKKEMHHRFVSPNGQLLEEPVLKAEIVTVNETCAENCLYEFRLTSNTYCPDLAYYPNDPNKQIIYQSLVDPEHPLVIRFWQNDYAYYRDLTQRPGEKFMYLYKIMK